MKVSLLITYFNRKSQFIKTMESIMLSKINRDNLETIIIDDGSDDNERIEDVLDNFSHLNLKFHRYSKEEKTWGSRTQVVPLNKGIDMATNEFILINGAEMFHCGDVLLDFSKRIKKNKYITYATLSLTKEQTEKLSFDELLKTTNGHMWYQHSLHSNRKFPFCAGMSKEDFIKIGRFAEEFQNAEGYADQYFIDSLNHYGIDIESVDSPYTLHLWHNRIRLNITKNRNTIYNNLKNTLKHKT